MNDKNLSRSSSDILVVDDVLENRKLLVNLLTQEGYKVRPASSGAEALDAVKRKTPDLILLDIKMPGMDGFEVCKRLKADNQSEKIPIIFISGLSETDDKVKAFKVGGVDYISKPFKEEEVLMRVQTHIELQRMRVNLESIVAERTMDLRMREATLSTLFNAPLEIILLISLDGNVLSINESGARRFNSRPEALIGQNIFEFMEGEVSNHRKTYSEEVIRTGKPIQFLDEREGKYFENNIYPVFDKDGKNVVSIAVFAKDITERNLAEQALKKEVEFQELVSKISTKFIDLPSNKIDQAINEQFEEIGKFFNADRVTIAFLPEKGEPLPPAHMWFSDKKIIEKITTLSMGATYPNLVKYLKDHEYWSFSVLEPDKYSHWLPERETIEKTGFKAALVINTGFENSILEIFVIDVMHSNRVWTENTIEQVKLLGNIFSNALNRKKAEQANEELLHDVGERLKELTCMYSISNSIRTRETIKEVFQDTVEAIPSGWHYPEITRGKLIFNNKEFVSEPFEETAWKQSSDIIIDGQKEGELEVYYLEEKPILNEGPFLKEERNLINSIAHTLAEAIAHKKSREALEKEAEFKQLVSQLSSRFIGLSGDKFEDAIQVSLAEIGRYFMVDAVRLFNLSSQGEVLNHRVNWQSKQLEPSGELEEVNSMSYPNYATYFSSGKDLVFNKFSDIPKWPEMHKILKFLGIKSGIGVPLESDKSGVDIFTMGSVISGHQWPEDIINRSKTIGQALLNAILRRETEVEIRNGYEEIKQLKNQLQGENIYLKEEINLQNNFGQIIGQSTSLNFVLHRLEQVAPTDANVLIHGETGTGKELFARALHGESKRKGMPLINVGCASLSTTLIESEFFGHEKGAFTGADKQRIGRFELADKGSIFLDEIGELSLELQAKLLRVLQEGEIERLGSSKTIKIDVRVIAATNRSLEEEVAQGRFREDLYYRLNTFKLSVPPLRDRNDDIPLLVRYFVEKQGKKLGKAIKNIPKSSMRKLENYSWPGNIRELQNTIENAIIISENDTLKVEIPGASTLAKKSKMKLKDVEQDHILQVLESTNWRLGGKGGAAELLGMKRTTLYAKMKKYNIERKV